LTIDSLDLRGASHYDRANLNICEAGEELESLEQVRSVVPCMDAVFTVRETHGRVLRPDNRLVAHSPDVGWRSLYAAIIEEGPFEAVESGVSHPFLIYHLSHPTTVMRKISGASRERALIGPRRICLTPTGATTEWQHSGHPEILQVYLRDSIYAAAVEEMYGCDAWAAHIVPRFAVLDPLLEQLAMAIATALRDGSVQDGLYVDTLTQMMLCILHGTIHRVHDP
jgi:AraC family transcriptional regulator